MKKNLIAVSIFLIGVVLGLVINVSICVKTEPTPEAPKTTAEIEIPECPYEVDEVLFSNFVVGGIKCSGYSYTDEDGHIGTFLTDELGHSLLMNKIMFNGVNADTIYLARELFIEPSQDGFRVSWLKMSL